MNIWDYLENGNFAGLAIFSLEDLLAASDEFENFAYPSNYQEIRTLKEEFKNKYEKDLDTKVKKAQDDYDKAVANGEIPNEDPTIVAQKVRSEYRNKLIWLLKNYFVQNEFVAGRLSIKDYKENNSIEKKDSSDLAVALVPIRRQLYTFLSVIGYYQYHKKYFLSQKDWSEMNYLYGKEVAFVNQPLGYAYDKNISLFLKERRLNKNKKKEFIDIDPISLETLIVEHLKSNINEAIEIAHIIRNNFEHATGDTWKQIQEDVNEYIKQQENLRLMIKV